MAINWCHVVAEEILTGATLWQKTMEWCFSMSQRNSGCWVVLHPNGMDGVACRPNGIDGVACRPKGTQANSQGREPLEGVSP